MVEEEDMELRMSVKERDRLKVLGQLSSGELSRAEGARLLGLSERQLRRVVRRYEQEGDAGLVHRTRGRVSNRRIEEAVRSRAVELIGKGYGDFGPTLVSEKLADRDGVAVSRETVRKWMMESGHWKSRRRGVAHRQWRPRRSCFGELIQMDTSEHNWFEGRGEPAVLIAMIDDATSRVFLRFYPSDTGAANREMIREYIRRRGRPLAIYADKASHFKVNRPTGVEEDLSGLEAETQVGRALRELRIEYIAAHSPQAKGRVERLFGTCQDRLIKELRLAGIGTIAAANAFLERKFIPMWNRRFACAPASPADAHRSRRGFDLDAILSHQETRTVANDYTLQHKGQRYQIERGSIRGGLRRSRVVVEERLDGSVKLRWRGEYLRAHKVAALGAGAEGGRSPTGAPAPNGKRKREPTGYKPGPDHPWKKPFKRTLLSCTKADISTLP